MQFLIYYLMALLVGGLGGVHMPINGALGRRIDSVVVATFVFYGIAFLLISALFLVSWPREAIAALKGVPRWYFLAGLFSVVVVGSNTYLIPRVGAVQMYVLVLVAQMSVRMVISHHGWLESPVSPITTFKVVGALLMLLGALLIVKN